MSHHKNKIKNAAVKASIIELSVCQAVFSEGILALECLLCLFLLDFSLKLLWTPIITIKRRRRNWLNEVGIASNNNYCMQRLVWLSKKACWETRHTLRSFGLTHYVKSHNKTHTHTPTKPNQPLLYFQAFMGFQGGQMSWLKHFSFFLSLVSAGLCSRQSETITESIGDGRLPWHDFFL